MDDPIHLLPTIDPIPLPAPVWLFKSLSYLTLTLHFSFLCMLLGGLALALVWNAWGHLGGSATSRAASNRVVAGLPMVTTYVINLGIPPLLFAQVLYGRALYTSSVLIGAWWISVVFAVMAAYAVLYRIAYLARKDAAWWGWGLVSLPIFAAVGRLFSANMTLMIRPDRWAAIYAADSHGTTFPNDPSAWARWAVVMLSALALGGLGTSLWSLGKGASPEVRVFLRTWTGFAALAFSPALAMAGWLAWSLQTESVRAVLDASLLAHRLATGWLAAVSLSALSGVAIFLSRRSSSWILPIASALPAVGTLACFVLVRDQVRDISLSGFGFDVWKSPVHTNWTVVALFLFALVAGLAVLGWIGTVLRGAKPAESNHV
jgi:hypothetical protein